MNPLQTIVDIAPSSLKLNHKRPILLIGSCFTEHIGNHLNNCGFNVLINPFGILYNPISIADCLNHCINNQPIDNSNLILHDGIWHSWLHHSSFSNIDQQQCLQQCNQAITNTHAFLQLNPIIILTLGTAWVYEYNGKIVANCHKVPNTLFQKKLLTTDNIIKRFQSLSLQDVIITISPIRHWADTPHGNQLSKSTLLLATNQLPYSYFPAYEIMMDELRDYRFYDRDMLHPSSLAVDLIWERFYNTYLSKETQIIAQKFSQLHKMKVHRPLFPQSEAYQKHLARIQQLETELKQYI